MSTLFKGGYVKLNSYASEVISDIAKAEKGAIRNAVRHMETKIKEKINQLGFKKHTGNLKKGVGSNIEAHRALVGFGPPAYHAHLLEFGTKERVRKSGKVTGHIKATPILTAVMEEEYNAVTEILSDRWLE